MHDNTEFKKSADIESIRSNTRLLTFIILLITFTLLLVNVWVLFSVLKYIPAVSVSILVLIVSGLVFIGFYLARRISLNAISKMAEYSNELNNLLIAKQKEIADRKAAEEKIHFLAYYDSLTKLPNRTFYRELASRTLEFSRRYNRKFAILFADLDFFKRINDTLGHTVGDQLLQAVGKRILNAIRKSDYIARSEIDEKANAAVRLGGDEFIILLNEINDNQDAATVAHRILEAISKSFKLQDQEIFITGSIGISIYPSDGEDVESLLKNADIAMHEAKKQGRNNYQFYSKAMNAKAHELLILKNNLHKALERKEFILHYQPRMDAKGRRVSAIEALIRWKQNEIGLVSPAEFIPLAEETGLVIPIGDWVLRTACLQNKAWQKAGFDPINISVNLSLRQFEQRNLIENIAFALSETDLDPGYLELEITESTAMKDPERAVLTLQALRDMGIKISIDDFGTGYSSLNYLRHLPLNYLKIDRSFVMNLITSASDASIVSAIISLAHELNLKVIAEGVETEEQFEFLRKRQCDEVQGYLFSRPFHADAFPQFLQTAKQT